MQRALVHVVLWLTLAALPAVPVASATNTDPEAALSLLQRIADDMVTALQDPEVRRDEAAIADLVDRVLVPHVDFELASRLVLGKHWRTASPEQRETFVKEFKKFILRFYNGALTSYVASNEVPRDLMRFEPVKADDDARQLYVRSSVRQQNGPPVSVDYRMYRTGGEWRVIDVSVEGISMAVSYRTNFASEIRRKGIDGLIASLRERNEELKAR